MTETKKYGDTNRERWDKEKKDRQRGGLEKWQKKAKANGEKSSREKEYIKDTVKILSGTNFRL